MRIARVNDPGRTLHVKDTSPVGSVVDLLNYSSRVVSEARCIVPTTFPGMLVVGLCRASCRDEPNSIGIGPDGCATGLSPSLRLPVS